MTVNSRQALETWQINPSKKAPPPPPPSFLPLVPSRLVLLFSRASVAPRTKEFLSRCSPPRSGFPSRLTRPGASSVPLLRGARWEYFPPGPVPSTPPRQVPASLGSNKGLIPLPLTSFSRGGRNLPRPVVDRHTSGLPAPLLIRREGPPPHPSVPHLLPLQLPTPSPPPTPPPSTPPLNPLPHPPPPPPAPRPQPPPPRHPQIPYQTKKSDSSTPPQSPFKPINRNAKDQALHFSEIMIPLPVSRFWALPVGFFLKR